ncbi:MAG: hypothetical protein PHQ23_12080 [Candidatus Wallbacteria bacterium]|nr:hypothetical protein [Candidatus Wallbacteria bacterium]
MADAFLVKLKSRKGLPGLGRFNEVFRDVGCLQGTPDFIAVRKNRNRRIDQLDKDIGHVGPTILSLLKPKAARTLDYLISHCEYSRKSVVTHLNNLIKKGLVTKTKSNSFVQSVDFVNQAIELWAFELKLNNPKRAVFQAQQAKSYSEHSIIVVPPGQEKNYHRFAQTMERWGIGLATFDLCFANES